MAAAVSPFARSSAFEESLLSAREQTVRIPLHFLTNWKLISSQLHCRLKRCTVYPRVFLRSRSEIHRPMVSHLESAGVIYPSPSPQNSGIEERILKQIS